MSSALTKTTASACLAAVPVFLPTAVAPAEVWQHGTVGHTFVSLPPTSYVMVQATHYVTKRTERVHAQKHKAKRKPVVVSRASRTKGTAVFAGGLDGLAPPPTTAVTAYQAAASVVNATADCNLSWTVLAGIGEIESHHAAAGGSSAPGWNGVASPRITGPVLDGRNGTHAVPDSDGGRLDGDTAWDRAVGPMQFLPGTWAAWGTDADGDGIANPQDVRDAALSAAKYLCGNGADLSDPQRLATAIFSYNHALWYVADVLSIAAKYGNGATTVIGPADVVNHAVAFGYDHLGDPYLWGGTGPLYDCSGFTQAAYAAAGIQIPRTSEEQWLQLPHVEDGQLRVGDLVFFNPGEFRPGLPGHVGIYLGNGYMIDDPHTGAWVRVTPISGAGVYIGAARPAALAVGASTIPAPVPVRSNGSTQPPAAGHGNGSTGKIDKLRQGTKDRRTSATDKKPAPGADAANDDQGKNAGKSKSTKDEPPPAQPTQPVDPATTPPTDADPTLPGPAGPSTPPAEPPALPPPASAPPTGAPPSTTPPATTPPTTDGTVAGGGEAGTPGTGVATSEPVRQVIAAPRVTVAADATGLAKLRRTTWLRQHDFRYSACQRLRWGLATNGGTSS